VLNEPEILLTTRRFSVVRRRRITNRGTEDVRETIDHPGAVAILPILAGNRVCLVRNFRLAVGEILLELPAGTLDPGEDPLTAAARELREETGYRAESVQPLQSFWMSPGILRERMHLFVATGLTPGESALEAGEEIETVVLSWNEALSLAESGGIQDAKTLVGLMLWDRRRDQVLRE
jgi:ADP-ribose pyrophosphatase